METSANLASRVGNWVAGRKKNGNNGLILVADAIEHCVQHKDWTALSRLIVRTEDADSRCFRLIIGKSLENVKAVKDDKHPEKIVFKPVAGATWDDVRLTNRFGFVRDNATGGMAFNNKDFLAALKGETAKDPAEWSDADLDKWAKRQAKTMKEHNVKNREAIFAKLREALLAE